MNINISFAVSLTCRSILADGKLSDIFGRKSTLVSIVIFFLVGSWLCGAARTMLEMSIARAIAGLGGGGIMTMASVVIHDLVPMRSRGQYQSYVNMAQTVRIQLLYNLIIRSSFIFRWELR
jgi:MFS family permease